MPSIRRLRAVLLFAVISAIGWAVIGTIIVTVFEFVSGLAVTAEGLLRSATIFAAIGFAAGTTWAVAVAMLPGKREQGVSPLVATLAGALGGILVIAGMFIAVGDFQQHGLRNLFMPLGIAGGIGATVGLLIQRAAARGKLTAGGESPRAIES